MSGQIDEIPFDLAIDQAHLRFWRWPGRRKKKQLIVCKLTIWLKQLCENWTLLLNASCFAFWLDFGSSCHACFDALSVFSLGQVFGGSGVLKIGDFHTYFAFLSCKFRSLFLDGQKCDFWKVLGSDRNPSKKMRLDESFRMVQSACQSVAYIKNYGQNTKFIARQNLSRFRSCNLWLHDPPRCNY